MGTSDAGNDADRSRKRRLARGQSGEPDVYEPEALPDVQLSQGDGDWFFQVLSVGDDHISIGTRPGWTWAIAAFFGTAVIGCLATLAVTIAAPAGSAAFAAFWLIPALCALFYCSWSGYCVSVDRAEGVIEQRRWFGLGVRRVALDDCGDIISGVMTFNGREVVGMRFVDRDDELLFEIRGTRTAFPDSVLMLAFAIDASRRTGMPLRVYYYPNETNALLKRLIGLLRSPSPEAEEEWDERMERLQPRRVLRPVWVFAMIGYMALFSTLGLILKGSPLLSLVGVSCILCIVVLMGLQTVQEKFHISRFGWVITGDTAVAVGGLFTILALLMMGVMLFLLRGNFVVGGKGREDAADGGDQVTITEVGGQKHVTIRIGGQKREVEGNVKLLREDERREVKRAALGNLSFHHSDERRGEQAVLDAIQPATTHADAEVRLAAVEALKQWGVDDTIPMLEPLLKDTSERVKNATKDAINEIRGRRRWPGGEPHDVWIKRVQVSGDKGGRKHAHIDFGGFGNTIPLCLSLLNDDERNEVRAESLRQMAHHRDPRTFEQDEDAVLAATEPLLKNADAEVRSAAVEVLKNWGTPAWVPKLEPLLNDASGDLRREAKGAIDDIRRRAEREKRR